MSSAGYGKTLQGLSVNLLAPDVSRALPFIAMSWAWTRSMTAKTLQP
jgi:hypothetical protein